MKKLSKEQMKRIVGGDETTLVPAGDDAEALYKCCNTGTHTCSTCNHFTNCASGTELKACSY